MIWYVFIRFVLTDSQFWINIFIQSHFGLFPAKPILLNGFDEPIQSKQIRDSTHDLWLVCETPTAEINWI